MAYANKVIRLLESPGSALLQADPLAQGLADISARFADVVSPVQHRRWTLAHRAWLFGVAAQIATTEMPTLDEYLTIRVNNAAGEVVTATAELVGGYEVPTSELELPRIRALGEMCRTLAALDNDLHSYPKTVALQEINQQNLVTVIATDRGCSVAEATVQAIALRDRIMCRFSRVAARRDGLSADTCRYLQDLGHVVRGNIDWAMQVPRYQVDGRLVEDIYTVGDTPTDASTDPPGISSIDWWWHI